MLRLHTVAQVTERKSVRVYEQRREEKPSDPNSLNASF